MAHRLRISKPKPFDATIVDGDDSGEKTLQWLIYFAVRPGGMDGTAGRAKSLTEVLGMTIPQLVFLCYERPQGKQGEDAGRRTMEDVRNRYADDPVFRERYKQSAKKAIQRAKDRLKCQTPD